MGWLAGVEIGGVENVEYRVELEEKSLWGPINFDTPIRSLPDTITLLDNEG
jgi:hypothetical protein